jgi:hypothetical protein
MNLPDIPTTIESKRQNLLKDIDYAINNHIIIGFRYCGQDFVLTPNKIDNNDDKIELYGRGINANDRNQEYIFDIRDIDDAEIFHVIREDSEFRIGKHIQDKVDTLLCFN